MNLALHNIDFSYLLSIGAALIVFGQYIVTICNSKKQSGGKWWRYQKQRIRFIKRLSFISLHLEQTWRGGSSQKAPQWTERYPWNSLKESSLRQETCGELPTCCCSGMNAAAGRSVLGLRLTSGRAGIDSNVTKFPPASRVHCPLKGQIFFSVERSNPAAVNYEQSLTIQSNNQFVKGAIYKGAAIIAAF